MAAFLPLGILLLDRSARGWTLAGGLAAFAALLAWQPWGGRLLRLGLILAVSAAGYSVVFYLQTPYDEAPPLDWTAAIARFQQSNAYPKGSLPPSLESQGVTVDQVVRIGRTWALPAQSCIMKPLPAGVGPHLVAIADLLVTPSFLYDARLPRRLVLVADVGPCLDVAFDAEAGIAVALRPDGGLDQFAYPSFRRLARYRLAQQGYRVALDGRRGRVYVAVSEAAALQANYSGDRPEGRGDLHVYDTPFTIPGIVRSAELKPAAVLPLGACVRSLLIAPDRSCLYYLARGSEQTWVGRVPVDDMRQERRQELPAGSVAALSPDGRRLCAAGFGFLARLDPKTLQVHQRLKFTGPSSDLTIANDGRTFIAGEGEEPRVFGFDATGRSIHDAPARANAHAYLRLHPNGTALFTGSSSRIDPGVKRLSLTGTAVGIPVFAPTPPGMSPVRGEFFLSPDGELIVTHRGPVYRCMVVRPTPPAPVRP
jgi:hypothetical protein